MQLLIVFCIALSGYIYTVFAAMDANLFQTSLDDETVALTLTPRVDSIKLQLMKQYSRFRTVTLKLNPLIDTVVSNGYTASPEELCSRIASYAKAFPGLDVDTTEVTNEIILEKFFVSHLNLYPDPYQVTERYQEFISEYPFEKLPSSQEINPILKCNVLLSSKEVKQFAGDFSRKRRTNSDRSTASAMEYWSIDDLRLHTDPTQCLVTDPRDGLCIASTDEFNGYLFLVRIRKTICLDSARSMVLRNFLSRHYDSFAAKKVGISGDDKDAFKEEMLVDRKYLRKNHSDQIQTVDDKRQLSVMYEKYYDRFFKKRTKRKIALLGSSDSGYIDSLFQIIGKIEADTTANRIKKKKRFITALPWHVTTSEKIPKVIASLTDTLMLRQVGKIVTPFGYFLCRVLKEKRYPKISFTDATDKLIYLYHEEKRRSGGKPDSVQAVEFYKKNLKRFNTPDTFICRTWLIPYTDSTVIDESNEKRVSDTGSFTSKTLTTAVLPEKIADTLLIDVKRNHNMHGFFGPYLSPFGYWYFSVIKKVPGGKTLPLEIVYEKILDNLKVDCFPFDSLFSTEAGERIKEREVLAGVYRRRLCTEVDSLSDKELKDLIQKKKIKITFENDKAPDASLFAAARQMFLLNRIKSKSKYADQWIDMLLVDRSILFTRGGNENRN